MLEQLKYINHINEVFEFGKYGIYVDSSDLRNYDWTVVSKNDRISGFRRKITKRSLPVIILCETEELAIAAKNRLFEVVEKDILAKKHGKIIIGNYYYKCFVVGSKKTDYLRTKKLFRATLTLTTDYPYWVKESKKAFGAATQTKEGLDYSFDYPFDYFASIASTEIGNSNFVASNFKMIIYGACSNPTVTIGGHVYQVNCTVGENEYLTIDSTTKRIYVTANDGTEVNHFNDRNKDSYIFECIPSGTSAVAWNGTFGFDIILLEERSEPKWT